MTHINTSKNLLYIIALQNQAACMLIKENEESRKAEIEQLKAKVEELADNETALKKTIQDLETEICDKNKVTLYDTMIYFYFYLIENMNI